MFYTGYVSLFVREQFNMKKILIALLKGGLFLLICVLDGCLSYVVLMGSSLLLDSEGPSLITYFVIGLCYIITLGRRGVFSSHGPLSFAMLPCFIPGPLFCISQFASLRSNSMILMVALIWIMLSRWPLLFRPSQNSPSLWYCLKKMVLLVALQRAYGMALESSYPALLEPLVWGFATPRYLKPDYVYPHQSEIQLFYENLEEAPKIEARLPEIIEILKDSPFYKTSEELVLVQKKKCAHQPSRAQNARCNGTYLPLKEFSYFFTGADLRENDNVYYSRNDRYRAVMLHELTHQLVGRYYGKYFSLLFYSTIWKQEGYAEYMSAKGCYGTKAELAAILREKALPDTTLEDPFSKKQATMDPVIANNYMAAFLQTRYALDEKKISPLEFFERSYQLASAQEIKDWLMKEDKP